MYIIFPILVIWNVSANLPSQEWEVTKDNLSKEESIYTDNLSWSAPDVYLPGKAFDPYIAGIAATPGNNWFILTNMLIIIANGILLLLSVTSSDILTLINISINKKRIETAPTYTNK